MNKDELFEVSPKDEIIDMINREVTSLKRRMGEVKDHIESQQNQVEREQNRYSHLATELRTIKDNLDTTPRTDIRDKYEEALESRFRLTTMRSQMEKSESNFDYMRQVLNLMQQVLTKVQGMSDTPPQEDISEKPKSGQFDIIGIIRAQEEERQRMARAMHDGPAQSLTNFILQTDICQRLFDRNPDRAAEELNNLKATASKTFQKVREFIFDLRPMMLDDLGVAPTVRRYVESYGDKSDIEVNLDILGDERRLENYLEVMIFRAIQDVMGLARDYANPTEINVKLDMSSRIARISVEDNGRGFDSEGIFDGRGGNEDARVQALMMLKGKFELVGGTIDVRSRENEGTTVRLELPTGE
jgi:two-component system, NarL family, sensor histidine kinase DegS